METLKPYLTPPKDLAEYIDRALEVYAKPNRWLQGPFGLKADGSSCFQEQIKNGEACQVCISGADYLIDSGYRLWFEFSNHFKSVIGIDPIDFSESIGQTQDGVIAALERCRDAIPT